MQNVLTYTSLLTSGMEHRPVHPSSHSNSGLSTLFTGASTLVQGDVQSTPATFASQFVHDDMSPPWEGRNPHPQPSTSLTSIPLPGNEVIPTHTPLSPSNMTSDVIPPSADDALFAFLEPSRPLHMRCGWRTSSGTPCGTMITYRCQHHFATVHGIINLPARTFVACRWCYPDRQLRRQCFIRHIREVHMSGSRLIKNSPVRGQMTQTRSIEMESLCEDSNNRSRSQDFEC